MSIGCFPKVLYKGDSVSIYFYIEEEQTGAHYNFKIGDKVTLGIKQFVEDEDYIIKKEFVITYEGTELQLRLSPEETQNILEDKYAILEVELTTDNGNIVKTVYQDKIYLKGVVIDE